MLFRESIVLFYKIRVKRGDNDLACEKTTFVKNSLFDYKTEEGKLNKQYRTNTLAQESFRKQHVSFFIEIYRPSLSF